MAGKHCTRRNPIGPKQPSSQEFKDSSATLIRSFELPPDYIASQHTKRYHSKSPTQTVLELTYTSSHDIPVEHQDSSSNEEIQGTTPKEAIYRVSNSKVDQLYHHTQAYLKSIGEFQSSTKS